MKKTYIDPVMEIIELSVSSAVITSEGGAVCPVDYHNDNPIMSGMPVNC